MIRFAHPCSLLFLSAALISSAASADDWPQWLGPQRDGVWREDDIVDEFPDAGLKVVWRAPVFGGYAGPAVADGRVFVTDYERKEGDPTDGPGIRNVLQGTERLLCLDAKTGKKLWEYAYPSEYNVSYPAGPRSTPTVDGDRVYSLGTEGHLACLDVATGKPHWKLDLNETFNCKTPYWGFSSHPLVDGDKLILVAGGDNSVAVALNKKTGATIWTALSAREAGYGTPMITKAGGVRQLIIWHPESINSLNPETGEAYWSLPLAPDYAMSINVPVRAGDYLFAGGIKNQALMIELDDDAPKAREVWRATNKIGVGPEHSPVHMDEKTLYAVSQMGELTAVDVPTGKRLWQTAAPATNGERADAGTAFLVRNDDRYFIVSETGDLIIAKLSRDGYQEIDRTKLIEPTHRAFGRTVHWSHPAYANKHIFIRNDKEIICATLAEDDYEAE